MKTPISIRSILRERATLCILAVFLVAPCIFYSFPLDLAHESLVTGDGLLDGIPNAHQAAHISFWDPYVNSGTPNLIHPNHQALYLPLLIAVRVMPYLLGFNILILIHFSAIGFFTYVYLITCGLQRVAAAFGGMSFMFCGFLSVHLDHQYMIHVIAWLPLTLLFVEFYFLTAKAKYLLFASGAIAGSIYAGHPQIALYCHVVIVAYLLFKTVVEGPTGSTLSAKFARFLLLTGGVFSSAIAFSLPQLLPIAESMPYIDRAKLTYEFFTQYSLPPHALVLFLFPSLFGSMSSTLYSNDYSGPWNLSELTGYIGILPLAFSLLAFIRCRREDKRVYFWSAVMFAGIFLSFGKYNPLYRLTFAVPVYNMFRVPARNLLLSSFAGNMLAALYIHRIKTLTRTAWHAIDRKACYLAAILMASLTLIVLAGFTFSIRLLNSFTADALKHVWWLSEGNWIGHSTAESAKIMLSQASLSSPSILIPLLTVLFSCLLLVLLGTYGSRPLCLYLCCMITVTDLFFCGHYFTNLPPEISVLDPDRNATYRFLRSRESDLDRFRILVLDDHAPALISPKLNEVFGILAPNNYGPITFRDYREVEGFLTSGYCSNCQDRLRHNTAFSILSIKYLLTQRPDLIKFLSELRGSPVREKADEPDLRKMEEVTLYPLTDWMVRHAENRSGGGFVLQTPREGEYSSASKGFALKKNTDYVITFEARFLGSLATGELHVDLNDYGHGAVYDDDAQERFIRLTDLGPDFRRFRIAVNSGTAAPDNCQLRFFTYAKGRVEIRNARMQMLAEGNHNVSTLSQDAQPTLYELDATLPNGAAVFENRGYLGRVRFVNCAVQAQTISAVNSFLSDPNFDAASCALVSDPLPQLKNATATIDSADFSDPDRVQISGVTAGDSLLVVSTMHYPGWVAHVDGREVPIVTTYGILQGVLVTGAGKHRVELVYRPKALYWGLATSFAYLSVLIVIASLHRRKGPVPERPVLSGKGQYSE